MSSWCGGGGYAP